MFLLFETVTPGGMEVLLVGIPESVGILVAGVVLTSVAVITRRLLADPKEKAQSSESK
jgi:hypothetical protein